MKKAISLILIAILMFTLGACGYNAVEIEDHEWRLTIIQSTEDGAIIGCAPEYCEEHKDIENLTVIDLICTASKSRLTISDKANNNNIYELNYQIKEKNSETVIYDVSSDTDSGLAVTSVTKTDDNSETPTLIITIGEYALNFQKR